jgi:PAS domain S-box-containing protein
MTRSLLDHRPIRLAVKTALCCLTVFLVLIGFSDQTFSSLIPEPSWTGNGQRYTLLFGAAVAALTALLLTRREMVKMQHVQHTLENQELYLASIFRAAPIGIGVVRDRIFVETNDRLCALTGYDREELINHSARMLYADDHEFERVGREKYAQIRMMGTGSIDCQWRRKDGRLIDVRLCSTPINSGDLQAGVTFTALDITETKTIEQHLRKRESHYHTMIELAVDGILIGDPEGIIVEANHHICTMFQLKREDLVGKHISALPFSRESLEQTPFRFDLLQRGETVISERSFVRPDGSILFIEMRSKMMPDGTYQSFYRDITVRKQTEQALRESEEKFALAFAASPDAININRLEDGLYLDINQGFSELSGYTWEDVRGKTTLDLNIWHDLADRQRLIEALQTQGYCTNLEAVFRKKDGSLGVGLLSARPIQLGNVPHILSITRDITQKKEAAADLERLRVAIEQAGEVVVITDTAGRIQYANPAFERTTGYALEEVYQCNPRILKSGKHDTAFYQALWRTVSSGQTWSGRMTNRKKDGSLFTEEATISPVLNQQGTIVNYVAIKRDITAQLKLEAQYLQAQKMESIGRLTGGVAHDFNNMLAVIIGYAEMAMIKIAAEHKAASDIERILEAAHRSADIVQQLLAFSRKQTILPKVININRLVEGMLKILRRLIGEDTELAWLPGTDLPHVLMDPVQIDQILANLCINARDAINTSGTIILQTMETVLDAGFCRQYPWSQPGRHVVLSVSDNGCGIDPEILDKIFDPFFTTKGLHGTGLGLATVYGIVTQNQGIITVDSQAGQGTTFTLYFPAHDQIIYPAPSMPVLEEPQLGQGETILLVEDDPGILDLGRNMLTSLGYEVLAARLPSLALETVQHHCGSIDLLITDVIMPEMNGPQLVQELIRLRPGLRILYMSGYTADTIAPHGVLRPEMYFLQKPFDLKTLSIKIKEALMRESDELPA